MNLFRCIAALILAVAAAASLTGAESWVAASQTAPGDFPLVRDGRAAAIVYSDDDFKVATIAATDLAADIQRVTGRRPELVAAAKEFGASGLPLVLVGTLGHSRLIDGLVAAGKIDLGDLRGQWESFVIATVPNPMPRVPAALVIVGSDRRGTAFGAYDLSQAIGVSPWYWWADVTPPHRNALFVAAGTRRSGPPSVKYRGIFLNDEDWGLQPWAAKTFEPEVGDIGPKTYAKIFELMLRLKANTVWPAMHAVTKPFNHYPQNKLVADDYAIVMGSSHAEPMLRNNVGEWTEKPETYNYITNREGVHGYWEQRVKENGKFENIYTLGMRGIHDSNMQGPKTDAERIRTLEQIFVDQRALLAENVRPRIAEVPQMFCVYKEVLALYHQGLKVPDDVTIVWPDDNFGYIRNYATEEERKRAGGFGVYYHLSYLGAPLSYLWLYTTPPALVWEEMTKAYDHGARTIWIANVGDLKPAEIGTEFFLQVAWDVERWRPGNLAEFLPEWAAREFGSGRAKEIAGIMRDYYRLNHQRKPEHLQWWMPNRPPQPSPFTAAEVTSRLEAFSALRDRVMKEQGQVRREQRDAFTELVAYPVLGSALANERYFQGERAALTLSSKPSESARSLALARAADAQLRTMTDAFNGTVAGGKWRGLIALEPADDNWRSMRIAKWEPPKFSPATPPTPAADAAKGDAFIVVEAEHYVRKIDRSDANWVVIPGLGRSEDAIAVFPTTAPSIDVARIAADAPRLDYRLRFPSTGNFGVTIYLLPTQPIRAGRGLHFGFGIDDHTPEEMVVNIRDGSAEWAQSVSDAGVTAKTRIEIKTNGTHTLQLYGVDAGVVIDKIVVDLGGLPPSYLGPEEKKTP